MMYINMKLNMGCTQFFVNSGYLGRAWGWYGRGRKKDQQGKNRGGGKGREEGIVRELEINTYTLLYLKQITNKDYCIAHGTLLHVMWQPGWEGRLGQNGCMRMDG